MTSENYPMALMNAIEASEGWKIRSKILIHSISYDIFSGNFEELKRVLSAYHDPKVGLPLWSVSNRDKLDLFQRELVRLFFNYLAAAKSLVEHTRIFVKQMYLASDFQKEYEEEVDKRFHNPFCEFVMDLRDFLLHERLPQLAGSLHFGKDKSLEFGITLDVEALRRSDVWSQRGEEYLETLEKELALDDIVNGYGSKVREFYQWFGEKLQKLHSKEFEQLASLQKKFKELYGEM